MKKRNEKTAAFFGIPFVFIALLIALFTLTPRAAMAQTGEMNGPGWYDVKGRLVSLEEADAYYKAKALEETFTSASLYGSPTELTPEIRALALALQNDPKLIFDYVHNHIDYVPYFGSLKGATLTLLEESGNDFDQASLMIALLRASNIQAQYLFGTMTIPNSQGLNSYDMAHWLGLSVTDPAVLKSWIETFLAAGQIATLINTTETNMPRVWVRATVEGKICQFDPAMKKYNVTPPGINLKSAMDYDQTAILGAAGGTSGANPISGLKENDIRAYLSGRVGTLLEFLKNNQPNAGIEELLGESKIIEETLPYLPTAPKFPIAGVAGPWDELPDYYAHKVQLRHGQLNMTFNLADIGGKKMSITYTSPTGSLPTPLAQLWLDDNCIFQETDPTGTELNNLTIDVTHPYYYGNSFNQGVVHHLKRGSTYVVVSGFGGARFGKVLEKRQGVLDQYRADGFADTQRQILTESLNVFGQSYLQQTSLNNYLLARLSDITLIPHHQIGLIAQEDGYYIDFKANSFSSISKSGGLTEAYTFANCQLNSALEHGVLEQQQVNRPAVSTIKLLQIANANASSNIYFVNNANFDAIKPNLNYTELTDLKALVAPPNNKTLILPANGQLQAGQWTGKGYISFFSDSINMLSGIEMTIGGGLNGGYAINPGPPKVSEQVDEYKQERKIPAMASHPPSAEPVDLATGDYLYDHNDLSLGGTEPLGIHFARSYNSRNRNNDSVLGYGWAHNYQIKTNVHSDGAAGFGLRQPADAASMLVAASVILDLMTNGPDLRDWVTSALVAKWAMDQITNNAVSVTLNSDALTFIKQPDGSYTSPPGSTTKLVQESGAYKIIERFGTVINFDVQNRISRWADVDGNFMTFAYEGDNLKTVTDFFKRTLTFNYVNNRLNSVADSTNRSVMYLVNTAGCLEKYTDPEGKPWNYGYDTGHRLTTLKDPLAIITATNHYDTLGHVYQQEVPRLDANGNIKTVPYNFYFSGYRNIEEDPAGHQTVYFFDKKSRTVAVQDALGNTTRKEYDGQDHAVTVTDPRRYSTSYMYDGNQNLQFITNAKQEITENVYDSEFRLTDVYDDPRNKVHYDYDTKHHLTNTKIYPDSTTTITTGTTYTANGLPLTVTNAMGTSTTTTYDAYGNPDKAKTGVHPVVDYTYDPIGNLTDVWDQAEAHTQFHYDNRGLVTTKTDPLLYSTNYKYYDDGHLWQITDRKKGTITYTYTPSGKVRGITYPDNSTVTFIYNNLDQLESMTDQTTGTTWYEYDTVGRLSKVTDPNGFVVQYSQYDAAGNLTNVTYPDNSTITYTYDRLNRLEYVFFVGSNTNASMQMATYQYDAAGRLKKLTNFNGTTVEYGYDNANRLTQLANLAGTTPIAVYNFAELDANGNPKQVDATEPLPPDPAMATNDFQFNTVRNRLASDSTQGYGYNDEGQQTATSKGGAYTFDYEHRLTDVNDGARQVQASYDGAGNRLKAVRNGIITYYIYDQRGNLLAEADSTKKITRYYIHGLGLMAAVDTAGNLYCYHYNQAGNTVAMTNTSQDVVNKYAYLPFGMLAGKTETAIAGQPFTFSGQHGVMAEANDLYYMRARYYDARIRRFISEDPIGFDGGDLNLYASSGGNPRTRGDPSGLSSLIFNRGAGTLTVLNYLDQSIGQYPAANNTTRSSNGPWPDGTYYYSYHNEHSESGATGPYGSHGNFVFDVPDRTGMGVHSGRSGPESKTLGCIRSTDEATDFLGRIQEVDRLRKITVKP